MQIVELAWVTRTFTSKYWGIWLLITTDHKGVDKEESSYCYTSISNSGIIVSNFLSAIRNSWGFKFPVTFSFSFFYLFIFLFFPFGSQHWKLGCSKTTIYGEIRRSPKIPRGRHRSRKHLRRPETCTSGSPYHRNSLQLEETNQSKSKK